MLFAVGADERTPVVKKTNAGGKTTLVQDPSSYYVNKGYTNLQNVNNNAVKKPTQSASTPAPTQTTQPAQTTGGGGGSSESSGGYSEPAFDWAAYFAELARQRQERADEAYKSNMERIANAYNSAKSSLESNYNSTQDRLGAYRNESMSDVNKDAENSLRQAYINNMLTRKNLNQRLSAMGYNGGAAESTMAQLENNYGTSRSGINETLNNNISKLDQNYGDNLANALQQYNSALSNLDMQRMQLEMEAEQQRQAAMESFYSQVGNLAMDPSYLTALQTALSNMSGYSYTPSVATNDYTPANVQQANSAANDANYAKYLAQARLEAANGQNIGSVKGSLFNAAANGDLDINSLYKILKQLGVY